MTLLKEETEIFDSPVTIIKGAGGGGCGGGGGGN